MKTLITYSSLTGNTKKVGEAAFEAIGGEKEIMPIKEVGDVAAYDRIVVGFWVDKGDACQEALEFMSKLENKTIGVFGTIGVYPDSEHAKKCLAKVSARMAEKNTVRAAFLCQGAIDPNLIGRMKKMATMPNNPHPITPEREKLWQDAASHPDAADLENARKAFTGF